MPKKYKYDYMIFSISKDFKDERENWDAELKDVVKRFAFTRFNDWVTKKVNQIKSFSNGGS